jgi:hypothetical protein
MKSEESEAEESSTVLSNENGKIAIGGMCYLTYPCQHSVSLNDGPPKLLNAVYIVCLCQMLNFTIPAEFDYVLKSEDLRQRVESIRANSSTPEKLFEPTESEKMAAHTQKMMQLMQADDPRGITYFVRSHS